MANKHLLFWGVALGGLALDQGTKAWIRASLTPRVDRLQVIPGWFDLVHAKNPGAAFGLLDDAPWRMAVFAAFTVVAIGVTVDLYRRAADDDRLTLGSMALVFSGILGNALDRLRFREVTDFLHVYVDVEPARSWLIEQVGTNAWPAFNVADSALFIGVGLFLVGLVSDRDDLLDETAEPTPTA